VVDLLAIFRAGFVQRWHTNPDLAHTCDRIDGHSARVARIILALHPSPDLTLIRAALIHDDGESVVGDVKAPTKDGNRDLADALDRAEWDAVDALWGHYPAEGCSTEDRAWLKFADRLDAYMWAAHHAPHVLTGDGWPEAREWLMNTAFDLDCLTVEFRKMMFAFDERVNGPVREVQF
jgi:hypothetical protein